MPDPLFLTFKITIQPCFFKTYLNIKLSAKQEKEMIYDKSETGKRLKAIRKSRQLTQRKVAEKVGINEKSLSEIERGICYPSFETFQKLLLAMNCPFNEFDNLNLLAEYNPDFNTAVSIIKNASKEELSFLVINLKLWHEGYNFFMKSEERTNILTKLQ